MNKEDLININGIREDLYQAMQIGDITLSSKHSQELYDFMNYQDKEIERLNNIINELEQENKVLLEKYSTIQILYNSSKLKNDKAIKYIKEHRRADLVFKLYLTEQETDNVLNILQGGDK